MGNVPLNRRDLMRLFGTSVIASGAIAGNSAGEVGSDRDTIASVSDNQRENRSFDSVYTGADMRREVKIREDDESASNERDGDDETHSTFTATTSESTADDHTIATESTVEVAAAVSGPNRYRSGFASDAVVDLWVGAYTPSDPVVVPAENETLEIDIERPTGGVDNYSVTTDGNGRAHLGYDLAGQEDGSYAVTVKRADGDEQTDTLGFNSGPVVDIKNNRSSGMLVGEETTISVLVRNGEFGAPNRELEITINNTVNDDEPIFEEPVETNEDGLVEISFTPTEPVVYEVDAELQNGLDSDSSWFQAAEVILTSGFPFREAVFGYETTYGGYLRTTDGQLSNTKLSLTVLKDPFNEDSEVITEGTVTTNEYGFFLFEYTVPEDIDEDRLTVEAETGDGTTAHIRFDRLRVDEFSDDPTSSDPEPPEPGLELDASVDTGDTAGRGSTTGPGGEITITVEATNGGDPLGGEEVDIVMEWDFGPPPFLATTVTTDDDGTASTTIEVPKNAMDDVSPRGDAVLEIDDTVVTDSLRFSIEEYDINFSTINMDIGTDGTLEVEAVEQLTGDPVEGVPLQFTTMNNNHGISAINTGELVTGTDGTDTTTVDVPSDTGPSELSINYLDRYTSTGANRFRTANHPGTLSITNEADEIYPGDTLTFEFDTEIDVTAGGVVISRHGRIGSFGTEITADSAATLTVPEYAAGQSFRYQLWATDGDVFYQDGVWISIEEDITEPSVEEYADDETGSVETDGVQEAVDDWRAGAIETELLTDVIDAWRTGEEIA